MMYKYTTPESRGLTRFYVSRKDQNAILKNRQWKWSINSEFYIKGDRIHIQHIPNVWGCIASTLLLPLGLLMYGLSEYKEIYNDMVTRTWHSKEYGAFLSDAIFNRDGADNSTFNALKKLVK